MALTVKIASIIGARPQFIKAAVVSRALARQPGLDEVLVHTGQHYDFNMSQQFFDELDIPRPDHHLGVGSGSHGEQTARMLTGIEQVLLQERPRVVLLYGDTNSTAAGALAAAKLNLPIAHVEAGLRSFNRRMPEEINRIVADHLSDLLFAPTSAARDQLLREGMPAERIVTCGDVMFDAALQHARRAGERSRIIETLALTRGRYALVTLHRAENTDQPARLRAVVDGLRRVAADLPVVWPVHPRTRAAAHKQGIELPAADPGFLAIEPVGYLDMILLEQSAAVIATDSGGVQKEAFFHGVPCVTLRDETEWVELVEAGCNRLCPPVSADAVRQGILEAVGTTVPATRFYGEGRAAEIIADELRTRYANPDGTGSAEARCAS